MSKIPENSPRAISPRFNKEDFTPPLSTTGFRVLHINLQSIRNKLEEFTIVLDENIIDAALINEHWLTPDELDYYTPDGYRWAAVSCRPGGYGGAAVLLKDYCVFDTISFSGLGGFSSVECVAVKICKTILVSLYRTPNSDLLTFFSELENILHFLSTKFDGSFDVVVGSDFNIDRLESSAKQRTLSNVLKSFNLYLRNSLPTHGKKCIDNFASNIDLECFLGTYKISDHVFIWADVKIHGAKGSWPIYDCIKYRQLSENNVNMFVNNIACKDWGFLHSIECVNLAFESFLCTVISFFDDTCPIVTRNVKVTKSSKALGSSYKWFSPQLRQLRDIVISLYDIWKETNEEKHKVNYLKCRKQYKLTIKKAKIEYNEYQISIAKNKCKASWKLIKNESCVQQHKKESSISAEEFNDFFTSIPSTTDISKFNIDPADIANPIELASKTIPHHMELMNFAWRSVTVNEVESTVGKFKSSDSKDYYGLSNNLVKRIIHFVKHPITFLINMILTQGIFPDCLKITKVVPIHKKNDVNDPSNFRPIALVPIFAKIVECIMKTQLETFFTVNNLFSPSQFGFLPHLSTIDAVTEVTEQVLNAFEKNSILCLNMLDLSKAFDSINHETLLRKMYLYGIRNKENMLIRSYLTNRSQTVMVKNQESALRNVVVGVPQGSVLGPSLFVIMINDLPGYLSCKSVLYADDTSLITEDASFENIILSSENEVKRATSWFLSNNLVLNTDKTVQILFTLKKVSTVNNPVKLLGINLDEKLTWAEHTNGIVNKLSRVLYLLLKLKSCVGEKMLLMAYHAFFQCHVSYGIMLWGNSTGALEVFLVQKRAIRLIAGIKQQISCKPFFRNFGILTLKSLYILNNLLHVKKNITNYDLRNSLHSHNTRSGTDLNLPATRLEKGLKSHNFVQIRLFNKLPTNIRQLPLKEFKSRITSLLLNNAPYTLDDFFSLQLE